MGTWSGGFGPAGRPSGARIPVKVHRNVSLIRVSEATVAHELLARPKLSRLIVGQMRDDCLLVRPGMVDEVVAELKKMGQTPRIVRAS